MLKDVVLFACLLGSAGRVLGAGVFCRSALLVMGTMNPASLVPASPCVWVHQHACVTARVGAPTCLPAFYCAPGLTVFTHSSMYVTVPGLLEQWHVPGWGTSRKGTKTTRHEGPRFRSHAHKPAPAQFSIHQAYSGLCIDWHAVRRACCLPPMHANNSTSVSMLVSSFTS